MKAIPYVYFAGDCAEALQFYREAIGAHIRALVRFGDMPSAPSGAKDKVITPNSELAIARSSPRMLMRPSGPAAATPSRCWRPTMQKLNGSLRRSPSKERSPCRS